MMSFLIYFQRSSCMWVYFRCSTNKAQEPHSYDLWFLLVNKTAPGYMPQVPTFDGLRLAYFFFAYFFRIYIWHAVTSSTFARSSVSILSGPAFAPSAPAELYIRHEAASQALFKPSMQASIPSVILFLMCHFKVQVQTRFADLFPSESLSPLFFPTAFSVWT